MDSTLTRGVSGDGALSAAKEKVGTSLTFERVSGRCGIGSRWKMFPNLTAARSHARPGNSKARLGSSTPDLDSSPHLLFLGG